MREPRKDFRANEEEYFRRQDAELIAKLNEEKASRNQANEVNAHKKHCSHCGVETRKVTDVYSKEFDDEHKNIWENVQVCLSCHQVAFPMDNLQKLFGAKDAKLQLLDLRLHVDRAKKGLGNSHKKSA